MNIDSPTRYCFFVCTPVMKEAPNGMRYPRWGGDGEAVRLEK